MCQFKANDTEIKPYLLYLGNIWKYFIIEIKNKNRVTRICVCFFSTEYNNIDSNDILDIHKYLMN